MEYKGISISNFAQEESRNISKNTRRGVVRTFEKGKAINHDKFMGYTQNEKGELVIVPEEAEIVRTVFRQNVIRVIGSYGREQQLDEYTGRIKAKQEEMTARKDIEKEQAMAAFQDILRYRGRLPEDFDADKELAEAREEKYCNLG